MTGNTMGDLLEKRRTALIEYSLGHVGKSGENPPYKFLRTPADLFELLRLDPLDSYPVQSSWVAEATSCAQQFIHAAYRKLEPGYADTEFDKRDLATWELYNNYPDWSALQMIGLYPENFINPFVRQRKTSLFKTLENNLNQAHLNSDSVQVALQEYLQTFEQTCNLDVLSSYMDSVSPARADYYFVGRQRVPPYQYFWRKAEVELSPSSTAINPAAWSEWLPVDTPTGVTVMDIRPVFWSGRLCLVWAEWQYKVGSEDEDEEEDEEANVSLPHRLDIKVAFKAQNGRWSAPLSLHSSVHDSDLSQGARLIATVWADPYNPKGKLGVFLTNDEASLKVFAVRDVLFRPLAWDDGGWLEQAALKRFVTAETVQHPLMNQPAMVTVVDRPGTMTPYLGLQAAVFRVDGFDELVVCGYCRPTGLTGLPVLMDLRLVGRADGDPEDLLGASFPIVGGWSTPWKVYRRASGSWPQPTTFTLGGSLGVGPQGQNQFQLTIINVTDFPRLTAQEQLRCGAVPLPQPGRSHP